MKISIIDYGLGNIFSINQVLLYLGVEAIITNNKKEILNSDAVILPGVGAFGDAMKCLINNDLIDVIHTTIENNKPFLGICLGMQLLFTESDEFGFHKGLNVIPGRVKKFKEIDELGNQHKIPQIQWNKIYKPTISTWNNTILNEIEDGEYMHFVHSYYVEIENQDNILSYSNYANIEYPSSVFKKNISGVQFHPEKSGIDGIKIYKNWLNTIQK